MKPLLPVAVLIGLCAGPAMSADALPISVEALPGQDVYTWAGPYGGAFVGYARADFDQPVSGRFRGDGFIGGIYAGYNLQTERLVYGLETDLGISGVDGAGLAQPGDAPLAQDGGAFGSLRARVGIAYDPILLFATGGLAVASNELSAPAGSDSATHIGWTLGAGVEASLSDNLTSRVEYRYTDYDRRSYDLGNVTVSSGYDEHSIRAGVALKF